MEALPKDHPLRLMYSDDIYPNGSYYPSPFGKTRYWIIGPEEGAKVTLIHGITTPSIVWKHIADHLASKGFRVLLYDLYGRGYSEAPDLPSDANLFGLQLALLLQYIGWESTDIVGFSIGGATTAIFTTLFPHLVRQNVVLMSSAGLMEPRDSSQVPHVTNETVSGLRALQTEALPRFSEVLSSTRREGLVTGLQHAFETIGRSDKRFLIVHGTQDEVVPFAEAHKIRGYIPQAELVPIEGASHYMPMEEGSWPQIADALVKFLA